MPYFAVKAVRSIQETFEVSWMLLTVSNNSPGGIRTCDQSVNSRSLYRWATEDYNIKNLPLPATQGQVILILGTLLNQNSND